MQCHLLKNAKSGSGHTNNTRPKVVLFMYSASVYVMYILPTSQSVCLSVMMWLALVIIGLCTQQKCKCDRHTKSGIFASLFHFWCDGPTYVFAVYIITSECKTLWVLP